MFKQKAAGDFIIYYHSGTTGWTSPTWNGYYTACIDATLSDFSALDANNMNAQGIIFTLNDDSNTATVGKNTSESNNAGYYGNNSGDVVLPANVTKGGKTYKVIGIGQCAFSGNRFLKSIEIGSNVTSVDPTAFLGCVEFSAFTVASGNTHFSANDGILYDAGKLYLYVYPCAKAGDEYAVPSTVKTIGTMTFANNCKVVSLTAPSGVQTIGSGAFSGCEKLTSIALPFIGGSLETNETFSYVFDGHYSSCPESLKTVVITGGKLTSRSFYSCRSIESISLPANDTVIPSECFSNCTALKTLLFTDTISASSNLETGHIIIPTRITEISDSAFNNCAALKFVQLPSKLTTIGPGAFGGCSGLERIEIPASVTSIGYGAFKGCWGNTEFKVANGNSKYCSDKWGVLYSKDMKELISYPSNRKWPYYNVPDGTTTIDGYAFTSCVNLVNVYIPNSVTDIGHTDYWYGNQPAISNCPGLTVCAYIGSTVYTYAGNNNITAWPMDNYQLQGIEIYSLPEKTVMQAGSANFDGMYVTMNVGKVLQLDDYTISYNPRATGVQMATVSYMGKSASFPIMLYGATDHVIDFGEAGLAKRNHRACGGL